MEMFNSDIKDRRLEEFLVPDLSPGKKYSMFQKVQAGVPAGKRNDEVSRLNDQFFRLLGNDMTFKEAYCHMVRGESPVLLKEPPQRKTRNSQVGKITPFNIHFAILDKSISYLILGFFYYILFGNTL